MPLREQLVIRGEVCPVARELSLINGTLVESLRGLGLATGAPRSLHIHKTRILITQPTVALSVKGRGGPVSHRECAK